MPRLQLLLLLLTANDPNSVKTGNRLCKSMIKLLQHTSSLFDKTSLANFGTKVSRLMCWLSHTHAVPLACCAVCNSSYFRQHRIAWYDRACTILPLYLKQAWLAALTINKHFSTALGLISLVPLVWHDARSVFLLLMMLVTRSASML
jgi:hypothetical protein